MLADISHQCLIRKDVSWMSQLVECSRACNCCIEPFGFSEMYVVQTRFLFLHLSGRGNTSIYNSDVPAVLEGMGLMEYLRGCMKECHFYPYISLFFGSLTSGWISNCAFSEPHHLTKASNHLNIS